METLRSHELFLLIEETLSSYLPHVISQVHLIASALLPIYTAAHAGLSRPTTAAKPRRRKRADDGSSSEDNTRRMEGLSPSDAILFPLFTGLLLTGLYYLIKWLEDPDIINKILNGYLSLFGVFSVTRFLTDICNLAQSFLLPICYAKSGNIWTIRLSERQFRAHESSKGDQGSETRDSPLPPALWIFQSISPVRSLFWSLREILAKPMYIIDAYLHELFELSVAVGPTVQLNAILAVCSILYFNLINKPWWLTNLMAFGYSYGVLQIMSPTTFGTGTLVMIALFFYDIYFVFFTPMMVTVAKKLDIPVKLLIPRPSLEDEPAEKAMAMLGLGDVVLPGIMIAMALRFDLHMFYLRKQVQKKDAGQNPPNNAQPIIFDASGIGRVEYRRATGDWGERFWLGSKLASQVSGGCFPKTYFHSSIVGYASGLVCTLVALHITNQGQPALLYLVPGVLLSLWGTALVRGELKEMWQYSELEEEESNKRTAASTKKDPKVDSISKPDSDSAAVRESESGRAPTKQANGNALGVDKALIRDSGTGTMSLHDYEKLPVVRHKRAIFSFSVRLPPPTHTNSEEKIADPNADADGKSHSEHERDGE